MSLRNKSSKELLQLTKKFIPPLLPTFHKGQAGRIAVIGGCEDYTGAPFFSAHASLLMGCDLTHIICEKLAAPIIKSYSPDLMVHPYLYELLNVPEGIEPDKWVLEKVMPKIELLLGRIHVVVLGPGFGRDALMIKTLEKIIQLLKSKGIPMILDADALYLVSQNPDLIANYDKLILTPNVVEFQRLAKGLGLEDEIDSTDEAGLLGKISSKLGGVTILQKGSRDLIVNGDNYIKVSDIEGSLKRVGGQGDSLTGCISTLLAWGFASYKPGLWPELKVDATEKLTDQELMMLSCFSGIYIVRTSAKLLFEKYGRAMQTSNLHEFIGKVYDETFGFDT